MNYPYPPQQQPGQNYPPPPGYPPAQQQPGYPPAQQYPPQSPTYYPPAPAYPQQPAYPSAPPAAPQSDLTIDDFYDQPAASGKSIAGWFQTPGQSISGVVARAISRADIRPQTDMQTKQPRKFNDGTPMSTMSIPLLVQPSADFPDGRAAWIVGSGDREDLDAAMQAAGCKPRTVPEAGAVITITYVGPKQIPGFGAPKKVKRVTYQRPANAGGAGNGQVPSAQADQPPPFAPAPITAPPALPATAPYATQPPWNPGTATGAPAITYPPPGQPQYQQQPFQPAHQPPPGYAQDSYAMATGQPAGLPQQQIFAQPAFADPNGYAQQPQTPAQAQQQYVPQPPVEQQQAPAQSPAQFAVPEGMSETQAARLRELTGG